MTTPSEDYEKIENSLAYCMTKGRPPSIRYIRWLESERTKWKSEAEKLSIDYINAKDAHTQMSNWHDHARSEAEKHKAMALKFARFCVKPDRCTTLKYATEAYEFIEENKE